MLQEVHGEVNPEMLRANKQIFLLNKATTNPQVVGYRIEESPWITRRVGDELVCPTQIDWMAVTGRRGGPVTLHSLCIEANSIPSFERVRYYFPKRKIDPRVFLPPDGHIVKIVTPSNSSFVGYHHQDGWFTKDFRVVDVDYWTPMELWCNYDIYGVLND